MYRFPLPRLGRFVLLAAVTTILCGGKPQVQMLPGYHSASLKHILILPVTGVPDVESGFMTSIISKTFEAQGHYQVVVYHIGQPEQFDQIMSLSRQVSGAVPLGMIPELGRLSGADAVVVTHQTTTVPVEGATDRFESRTGAITRNRLVSGNDGPIAVFYHDGQVHAVDNRCPPMGFPLHRGTVKDGILT